MLAKAFRGELVPQDLMMNRRASSWSASVRSVRRAPHLRPRPQSGLSPGAAAESEPERPPQSDDRFCQEVSDCWRDPLFGIQDRAARRIGRAPDRDRSQTDPRGGSRTHRAASAAGDAQRQRGRGSPPTEYRGRRVCCRPGISILARGSSGVPHSYCLCGLREHRLDTSVRLDCVAGHIGFEVRRETGKE